MIGSRLSNRAAIPLCLAMICLFGGASTESAEGPQDGFVPPEGLEEGWYARVETDMGMFIALLLPDQAPQSVAHFAGLAEGTLEWFDPVTGEMRKERYYDGISIDLAKAGERFEAGGLDGEPGKLQPQLFAPAAEGQGPVNFSGPGRLGMTRASGAQVSAVKFFVTAAALPRMNGPHPCFGKVVEGGEVVFSIAGVKTHRNGRPVEPVTIRKIRIFSVGEPDPLPEPVLYSPSLKKFSGAGKD